MELSIGSYSLPLILTVVLAIIYSRWEIDGKYKPLISIGAGIVIALVAGVYGETVWTAKATIQLILTGVMAGAASCGLYDVAHKLRKEPETGPRAVSNGGNKR